MLLECVPNVSEGRRPEALAELVRRVQAVAGAHLLDASRDPDHHRSVLTLAGPGEALHETMLSLYEYATNVIDLSRHDGVHPRVGAIDVVPFVPLGETPMSAAVAAARRLGSAVAERFSIPVYLYEEAALRPERKSLPLLRQGGLPALDLRIGQPGWEPDFGPPRLHPTAGATILGARPFLIAVNVLLGTDDLELAREIARAVRESSGGLPAVRALGLPLAGRGRVQVSMNLVDHRRTGLGRLLAEVRRLAEERGARVIETEIIGLAPEAALADAAAELVPGPEAFAHRSLERRLAAVGVGSRAVTKEGT